MNKILLALPLLFVLGACTPTGQAGLAAGIDKIRAANDTAAQVTMQLQCAIPFGAVQRMHDHQQLSVKLNCDPDALDDLIGRITQ